MEVCLDFNARKGCKRKTCDRLHEKVKVAPPLSTRHCRFFNTKAGCRREGKCDHRHDVAPKRVVPPPTILCELRSPNLFEYAPTRDNKHIEADACSQHWSRANDVAGVYPGKGPHIQMVLFDVATRRPLGVLVFGGSVCLEWMADGSPAGNCGDMSCNFWHAPLGSLHSDLVRAQGACRLMEDRPDRLRSLAREVGKSLLQPIQMLGEYQAAQLDALVKRNDAFHKGILRARYTQTLILSKEAGRDAEYARQEQLLRDADFTVEELTEILADDSKMLAMTKAVKPLVMAGPTGGDVMAAPTGGAGGCVDIRSLLGDESDDHVSVTSGTTQQTALGDGVLRSSADYVDHAATLKTYVGERLRRAMIRYPADAQRAFDSYVSAAVTHYEHNLSHAKDLHAYGIARMEYKLRCADGTGARADQTKVADMYHALQKGVRGSKTEERQLRERDRKARNTGLLAKALQPTWKARTTADLQAAIQQHGPPDKYKHRSSEAVFWINMHRLAIGEETFEAEGSMSLAGDVVQHY